MQHVECTAGVDCSMSVDERTMMPVDDEEPLSNDSDELVAMEDCDTLASPDVPDDAKSELDRIIAGEAARARDEAAGDAFTP
jgi:hypothetical protein